MPDTRPNSGWADCETAIAALNSKQLFFVTGAVKSGTTWTQLWLDEHPELACRGEGAFFHKVAGALQKLCEDVNGLFEAQIAGRGPKHPAFPKLGLPQIEHLLRQTVLGCMSQYGNDPAIRAVGEKTPSTVLALDTVFRLFPEAKVLHVVRDGRDVCISAWHDNLRKESEVFQQTFPTFGTFLPEMARIWVKHQRPILDAPSDRSAQIRSIRYEDLIDDPTETLRGVFDWLSVDASDAVVRRCLEETKFEKLSEGRKRGEADPKSFYRSGTAGQWRSEMTAEQQNRFWKIAGSTMTELGYARDA